MVYWSHLINHNFLVLDLAKGYYQNYLDHKFREITVFITHNGLFQFKMMPFVLRNAPSSIQFIMNNSLKDCIGKFCLFY